MATIDKSQIKGIRLKKLQNLSYDTWQHFGRDALEYAVKRLAKTANSRLQEFRAAGMKSPATEWAKRSGGKFTTKGKSFQELRSEFSRVKSFLEQETSTISGYEDVKEKVKTALQTEDIEINTDDYDTLWETYDILKEKYPWVAEKGMKYEIIKKISQRIESYNNRYGYASKEDIARSIGRTITRLYEKYSSEASSNVTGTSQFFRKPR